MDSQKAVNIQSGMNVKKRINYTGRYCVCNTQPAYHWKDAFRTGNGTLLLQETGNPYENEIRIQQEELWCPRWENAMKAPLLRDILEEVQVLIMQRRFEEADRLAHKTAAERGTPAKVSPSPKHNAAVIRIMQSMEKVQDYLHVQNMATGEILTVWENENGSWEQRIFSSRADDVAVIQLKAVRGNLLMDIGCELPSIDRNMEQEEEPYPAIPPEMGRYINTDEFTIWGKYAFGQGGFLTMGYLVNGDCKIAKKEGGFRVFGGTNCMLLLKTIRVTECDWGKMEPVLRERLKFISHDYDVLLKRHTDIHTKVFERLSLYLGGNQEDYLLTIPELKEKQFLQNQLLPAYVETMVSMGRYFLLCECGKYPPVYGHVNINVNHQISAGNIGNMPEMMESFFKWIENQLPDARENAQRVFGTRGFIIACHPDEESGLQYHFDSNYPHEYWISSSGWCLQPFLEHYYCTGDEVFRKNRMIPLYKELALFYSDFLVHEDENGKYIFVPSYSPENYPSNYPWMLSVNAAMDIEVCREVLETLLAYGGEQITAEESAEYRRILQKLPDYLYGKQGEIKEWIASDLEERHNHRHISQLYGAYPGDEFQPENNYELYQHARKTNRMRGMENESCHGVMHRAQIAARLKDSMLVEELLRFTLEGGFVNDNATTAHNPYLEHYFPDGQGGLPTVVLEALIYARPGWLEILPGASSGSFRNGSLAGMALRTFAELEYFVWNEKEAEIVFRPLKSQTITFLCRKEYHLTELDGACIEKQQGIYLKIRVEKYKMVTIQVKFKE